MATYLLIPGAGGVAWYWSRLAPLLEQAGHRAIAVDLPGDDESAGLPEYADLAVAAADGARRRRAGRAVARRVHRAGGLRRGVAVRELVFVNAMIPKPGESPDEWWRQRRLRDAHVSPPPRPAATPIEIDLATYFLHDVDPAVAAEGEPYQRNEAQVVFDGRCELQRWPDIPIRVLAGADDRFFPADLQRRVAAERLGVDADVLPGGHLIALSNAPAVADYLLAAAP